MNVSAIAFGDKYTPEQVLLEALSLAEGAKHCVVVLVDKDDGVLTGWSNGSMLARVGMCHTAAARMMEAALEGDE